MRQILAGGAGFILLCTGAWVVQTVPTPAWPAGVMTVTSAAFIALPPSAGIVVDTYTRDIALAPEEGAEGSFLAFVPEYVAPPPPPAPEPPPVAEPIPEPAPKPAPLPEVVKEAPPPIVVPEVKRRSYPGLGVKPHVQDVAEVVGSKFGVKRIGGYRPSGVDRTGHPAGLAIDFMVDRATGDKIAEHLRANTGTYGVKYVIYRQRIALPGKEWRGMGDRGDATANHMDHVHLSLHSR